MADFLEIRIFLLGTSALPENQLLSLVGPLYGLDPFLAQPRSDSILNSL